LSQPIAKSAGAEIFNAKKIKFFLHFQQKCAIIYTVNMELREKMPIYDIGFYFFAGYLPREGGELFVRSRRADFLWEYGGLSRA